MSTDNSDKPIALVADDDEVMRLMLTEAATSAGFQVFAVEHGAEALKLAEHVTPDVILLDVNMPVMDGFTACATFRERDNTKSVPIVVVTGDDDSESVNRAYQSGATDFVAKPINWSLMAHRLRYILRGWRNLQALQAREKRIHKLAFYDATTGLPNREFFREKVEAMLLSSKTDSNEIALIYLGLDGIKRIVDSFGHAVGDKVVASIARRLTNSLAELDSGLTDAPIVARIDGDEFVAAVRAPNVASATREVSRHWFRCLERPFSLDGNELQVTPHVGVATFPTHGDSFDTLMKNASTALFAAKSTSNQEAEFYCDTMHQAALERLCIESGIRDALRRNLFEMYYQPKYDAHTGQISGAEALIRWNDKERGFVSPAMFIAIAEESGLIGHLTRWVIDDVCRQVRRWSKEGIDVPIAVNLSPTNIIHGDCVRLIKHECERHGIRPSQLEVEITESTLMCDIEKAASVMDDLKDLGIQISVDDFGTGFSSLSYLKRFKLDTLKIDRVFVQEVAGDNSDSELCSAIIAMAKSLSLSVVAEGVETAEQYNWLLAHGCDYIQGYFLSRPMPADDFADLLLESKFNANPLPRAVTA